MSESAQENTPEKWRSVKKSSKKPVQNFFQKICQKISLITYIHSKYFHIYLHNTYTLLLRSLLPHASEWSKTNKFIGSVKGSGTDPQT